MSEPIELETLGVQADEKIPYTIIENYIFDIEGLSANKKLFLLMLRRYCGSEQKPAFPSYKKLMKDIGVTSASTIIKCIDFFIWLKWLEKINRSAANKEKLSNYYILSLKNIKVVLEHFKKNNYNFKDVEAYFELGYKDKKTREIFLKNPCKYLIE